MRAVEDLTVPEALARAARAWPEREVLHCERRGQRATFAELDALVDQLAGALRARGVGAGDLVGVMFRNDLELPVAWLAVLRVGAAMVPLNVHLAAGDLAAVLRAAQPRTLLAAREFGDVLAQASAEALDGEPDQVTTYLFETTSSELADLRAQVGAMPPAAVPATSPQAPPRPESLANVQFTSGSTGLSKGCLLSHRYWIAIGEAMRTHGPRIRGDDVLLTAQPFYYMDPQWNLVVCLLSGARLVVLERFRSTEFWPAVQRHGATYFYCLGVMPAMMLRTPPMPGERESRVRYVSCSGIPAGRHAELERRYGAPWHELYGSTETGLDMLVEVDEHDRAMADGSLGRPMPNREVRVLDVAGRPLPRGSVGRLVVRGVAMSDGYLDGSSCTVGNGWYITGDLASVDADGLVTFAGREKDVIRRSGENISAAQVEHAVETHPDVRLCACVPAADEVRGEEVKAYVVPVEGRRLDVAALAAHARDRLAYFKVPRYWEIRDALPLTPSEKVAKAALRAEPAEALWPCYDAVDDVWLDQVPATCPPSLGGPGC